MSISAALVKQLRERTEILVLGADCLTGHDPATGAELWRWSGINPRGNQYFRCISSPVTAAS